MFVLNVLKVNRPNQRD